MKHLLLSFGAAITAASACASVILPQAGEFPRSFKQTDLQDFAIRAVPVSGDLAGAAFTRAADEEQPGDSDEKRSMDFTLAYSPSSALRFNDVDHTQYEILQAFEISAANTKAFAGTQLTAVNITTGVNSATNTNLITKVSIFLTYDLGQVPFYEQEGTLGEEAFTQYSVELDTPYTIEAGKPFYVGYALTSGNNKDQYIVTDDLITKDDAGGWCGIRQGYATQWNNTCPYYGNICLGARLEGDNLPVDGVLLYAAQCPDYVEPGVPFDAQILIAGAAANKAESVEVSYSIGSSPVETFEIKLDEALGYHGEAVYTISGLVCDEQDIDVPLNLEITKVNGVANSCSDNKSDLSFWCYDKNIGYPRTFLVEEGTGTWCGYCPAGMVVMEYMRENYPDEFARVAIHASSTTVDPMEVSSTIGVIQLFTGFPEMLINRGASYYPTDPNIFLYVDAYAKLANEVPSLFGVEVEGTVNEEGKLDIDAYMTSGLDYTNDNRFRFSFYLSEDYVGPYVQTNYFAGSGVSMGGWEKKGQRVKTMYDDVVRMLVGKSSGMDNSLPATFEAGEKYSYMTTVEMQKITYDEFYLTAMIVDSKTNTIVNSKQVKVANKFGVGVSETEAAKVDVKGLTGGVEISGAVADVYDFSGACVARQTNGFVALPAGFYLVSTPDETFKVVVR